jgi:amino acid adenylation domain-containing protein
MSVYLFPASVAQESLWLADRFDPGNPAYNVPAAARLTGPLDAAAFASALQDVVDRHEALRTTFRVDGDDLTQVVHESLRVACPVTDVSTREIHRFDLTRGPLLRAELLRLGPEEHVLLLTLHHIVADGASVGVLLAELGAAYLARRAGHAPELPELPFQYADYAVWHREQVAGERVGGQLPYWRDRFASRPEPLELPWDRPRPPAPTHTGHRVTTLLDAGLTAQLDALASSSRASLFMVLATAYAALLRRHTDQPEVVIGTPVANRTSAATEALIGYFVNLVALRLPVPASSSFAELLGVTREHTLGALANAEVPFDTVVSAVRQDHDTRRSPLFQAMFALQNAFTGPIELPGLRVELLENDSGTAKYDVNLLVERRGAELHVALEVNADVLDRASAQRLLTQYGELLTAAAAAPATAVADLPIGDTSTLVGSSATDTTPVAERILAQACRTPDAVAVRDAEGTLTYAELVEQSRRIAGGLRARGVGPGDLVAIGLRRGRPLLPALLGIWLAGAGYVPVEPSLPAVRRERILAAARPVVELTDETLPELLATPPVAAMPTDPDGIAYVLFTSGSTGVPKGVRIPHSGLANYLGWALDAYGLRAGDAAPVQSPLGFDFTLTPLLTPLLAGGEVVLLDEADGVEGLGRLLADRSGFGLMKLTPAHLEVLLRTVPEERLRTACRVLVVGGDALPPALARRWLRVAPDTRLVNEYGPTEAVVGCCVHEVSEVDTERTAIPIGRPVAGTTLSVMADGRPVADGAVGELWVGGNQVAAGYLDDPERTAEKFVDGGRLYRTGDRVRRLATGDLEYLGRSDRQLKIRGYRVEPGEVEAALLDHPTVREAVVVPTGQDGLAGYVAGGEPAELRAFLSTRLPAYLVPDVLVSLPALPLTVNGKVDLAALPDPGTHRPRATYEPPRPGTEQAVAEIWSEVLGVPEPGRADDFVRLGGHSLSLTRVVSRLRDRFGVELGLRQAFEHSTLAALAALVDATPHSTSRATGEASVDLSFAQQRLWFLDQLTPGDPTYHVPVALRLRGAMDRAALSRAVEGLAARHEALRTSFHTKENGDAITQVADAVPLPVEFTDLSGLAPDDALRECDRMARAQAVKPFDLTTAPLLRVELVRLAEHDHVLLVTIHHIVSDGWSVGVLLRDFAALYTGHDLPPLTHRYADHTRWQRARLDGGALDDQLAYWHDQLRGLPVLTLPTDRSRQTHGPRHGGQLTGTLSVRSTVEGLAARLGVTPFAVLLAAFYATLHHYTGQQDLAVASPVAQRTRREVEDLVGCFVNVLVLREQVNPAEEFTALVRRVAATNLDAQTNQDVPYERLADGGDGLAQAMFGLQNVPAGELSLPGLAVEELPVDTGTARFDLTLLLEPRAGEYGTRLEYDAGMLDRATAERILASYRTLLSAALTEPGRPVGALPVLTAAERAEALLAGHGPHLPVPNQTVTDLFADVVRRRPNAPAVQDATGTLTYAELDARVTHVANRLRARGAGRNTPVALLLGRGQDFLTAILAVFRAGAAYLPLDPQHPVERQLAILTSSGAPLLIHDESALAKRAPVPALRLTDLLAEPTTPTTPATPTTRDLAYVIYTSGSTGVPKGAMVEQAGMVNHLLAKVVDLSLGPDDVVVQNAPVCFDISVWQYLAPLLVGGRVWVATDDQARDPRQLWQGAAHAGATVLEVVPSLLRAALTEPDLAAVPTLRCLMVTGEALPPDLVGDWLGRRPDVPVVNAYGPTECSDDVTHAILRAPLPAGTVHAPIGSPVANLRLYVLDPHGEPVPVGVAGELFVGGIGVGRGYLGDPTKTAERFVPDPFGPSGTRLYRTGDRVRRRADGSLEFLGRVDHQVKVRGHRIEPGEIEVALRAHPAVDDCVVTAVDDRLAAYVTGSGQPTELRDHLAARLPEYMVPAAFTTLDALPLTPNGKVDRATLPAPVWAETAAYVEPRTDLERAIAQAWAEVLEVPRVGAHDSFFALGGHSLLAVRAAAVLRARLAHDVPVRALFDTPTPAGLAAVLETRETVTHEPIPVAADREVLSFAQQRMWFFEQREPGTAVFIMPGGYRIRGALDVDRLATALTEVVARHEVLRTTYQDRDGVGVASVEPAEPVALPVHDLRGTDQDVAEHAREESTTPFDLSQAPMVRARLLRLADEDWLLLVTVHHLAADGGSVAILLDEVLAGYAGREIAPPPVQYADFAAWQRERTTGDLGRTQLAYWREQLAGDPPVLQLPTDRPRQERREYRGELVTTTVPAELATRLRALAGDRDGTLFMVLLAAFQFVAHRWSGERDVVVGIPVDGRDHEQLARLVGCFINTLPIRTQIQDGNPSELIDQVRGTVLDALANQDVPFQAIVAELRDSFAGFDVLFNMLDPHDALAGSTVDGLTVTPFGDELTFGAKFDLTVYARDLGADGISIMAIHDAALFDQARITELLNQYLKVLDAFAADTRLEDITLATSVIPAEPRIEWAGSVVDRLVAHAAATPDAPAVGDRYTYAELDAATRQVAAHLVTQGVSPGDVVAIHAHRTAGLVAAVLGVMRAGAVFTLVDPAYPPAARAERVELAGAVLELDPSEIPAADDDFPPVPVDPDAPAYLTFTSGTTGKPRMVAASPRPLTHFLAWHTEKWGFGPTDRFSALSGVAHDPFLRDILTPVWCGASVHLPDTETVRDPDRLAAWLAGHEITVTHLTPSVARLLAAADETHRLPRLRHAFFGGEVATGADGTRLAARAPGVTCVNFYGATETPQAMAYHVLQDEPGPVPLGHGIDGVRLLVERAPGRPAGIGELGEIVVATPYLSLGYPLEPELTARRFGPGTYRTGDLGRYRPDGAVVFAGRADRQASVRGHRVEPAEIEAVLAAHPAVRQVHVDTSDGLTAYVVGTVTPGWLADRLPEHLIPAVVALPALPLTPNGKLDRAALAPSTVVDPRTDAEHAVYAIWRDVLPDRRFGVTDDFFVAGGHSLAAGQIMARVRKEFGVDLPLAALFEANTVAALAERVEEAILAQLDEMTDDEIIALSQREAS